MNDYAIIITWGEITRGGYREEEQEEGREMNNDSLLDILLKKHF